ncbi:unnamed protein product, partial [Mesorhabditis belari]|uniref:Carbonic anhydrase n=1 Tax=Mesorhabditis belari TaxID=2138241 RepID=A0AAF3FKB6_9BILA
MQLIIATLLIGFALCGDKWGYDEDDGPANWEGLCQAGQMQSPIDFRAVDVEYSPLHKLIFMNYHHKHLMELSNNGHTIAASSVKPDWESRQPYITGGGLKHKYKLMQFHLHWADVDYRGSEHTIGGLSYPAELHLVHYREDLSFSEAVNKKNGLAVVGVFLTIGEESRPLEHIVSSLKQVIAPGNKSQIHGFHLHRLLPINHDSFYRYDGSLTTPGCFESVIWTVLTEPISITKRQMEELRAIHSQNNIPYEYNHRPVQPLNGRKVLYRPSHFDKSILCSSTGAIFSIHSKVGNFHVSLCMPVLIRSADLIRI